MAAVYKRELRSYFTGITGYIFIAALLLFVGIYTYVINFINAYPTFEYTLYNMSYIYLIIVPILTMRIIAEDRRQHTSELLYSLPLPLSGVVLGKYLALLTVLAAPCAVFCLYPLILALYGTIEFGTAYSTILGFFLLGASLLSVGLFISSLTDNLIVSAVMSFGAVLLIYLISSIAYYLPSTAYGSLVCFVILILVMALIVYLLTKNANFAVLLALGLEVVLGVLYFVKGSIFEGAFPAFLGWLSLFDFMTNFASGLFDLTAVVYYLSFIAVFVFFTILSLEKRRWS